MAITDQITNLFSSNPDSKEKQEGTRDLPTKLARKTKTRADKNQKLTRFWNLSQDIDPAELKRAYKYESCTHKAINKRAEDCFEKWFNLTGIDNEELDSRPVEVFRELKNRTDMQKEFIRMVKQAQILGHGYCEIVYMNDSAEVYEEPDGDYIEDIALIDSESIGPVIDGEVGSDTHGEIIRYEQKIDGVAEKIEIHPDRIISFPWTRVGTEAQGVPAIQPVFNIVKSKILLDQLIGDIPESVVSQLISLNIEGADEGDIDEAMKFLEEVENAGRFAGSEKHEFNVHDSGEGLNIEPYTEHAVQQLSVGLGVPKTIMLGAGAGEIATAEVNLQDYYSDIRNIQKRFESIIREVIDKEYELQGVKDIDYEIDWNKLYTNDEKESEIMFNKSKAARNLVGPQARIFSPDEAREEIFGMEPLGENETEDNNDLPY